MRPTVAAALGRATAGGWDAAIRRRARTKLAAVTPPVDPLSGYARDQLLGRGITKATSLLMFAKCRRRRLRGHRAKNAQGVLPELMVDVGFDNVDETHVFETVSGSISI
jgi:hypothetical protein